MEWFAGPFKGSAFIKGTKQGAVIGAGANAKGNGVPGSITFESGTYNLETNSRGAAIGGSSPATVAFADNGTDFTVKSEQACAVMLLKADGTVQTLKATASGDAYAFSAEGAAEGDQVVVALKGDTNLDGKHTAADAVMAKAAALGKLTPSPVQEAVANVNGDSKITAADAVMIKAITLGKTEAKW